MLLAYCFKLNPSKRQTQEMGRCLNLLRLQYNWRLRERIEAYEQVTAPKMGAYSDLETHAEAYPLTCSVSKSAIYGEPWKVNKEGVAKKRSTYEQQSADLPSLKAERPWYKTIPSQPLQQVLRQLDDAFKRFFSGQSDFPKSKRRGKLRSFTYPPSACKFEGNKINLAGFCWMKFYQSRPFPDGFAIRKVTVCKKADGYYISVCLEDDTVPDAPQPNEIKTAVGVDVGIKKLASLSNGKLVANPRFYARQERKRNRLNRAASRKKKGSNKRKKAYERIARLEQKVTNQREDYQWKIADKLTRYDLVVFESLNIKNMMKRCKPKFDEEKECYIKNGQAAKSGLNKAIQDASWYSLRQKVRVLAERYGVLVHEINPRHTSQECSVCGYISPKNRDGEKFLCESCGHHADADIDAAVVILQRGLSELGSRDALPGRLYDAVRGDTSKQGKSTPTEISSGLLDEPGNRQKVEFKSFVGVQLNLFDWMGA